jgi:tetratricopeptide (TPR) repeat protein
VTAQQKEVDRKIVPRWHSLAAATRQRELAPLRAGSESPPSVDEELAREAALLERTLDWTGHRTTAFAADLVAAGVVLGPTEESRDAAQFLLAADVQPLARELAQRLLGEKAPSFDEEFDPLEQDRTWARIRELKRNVRLDPRTALVWAELARRYASLGQREKAHHAMTIALAIAPNNRFLLRSGARLNIHLDDPERAHRLLARASATPSDPWLVAAEIAVAPLAGRQSRLIRHGKRLVQSGKFYPVAVSELASALGTESLAAGGTRDARRLFRRSLDDPTENAVAQVEWASRHSTGIEFDERLLEVEDSFEARARVFADEGKYDAAITNAWDWFREQPFSDAPAIFGSHLAALARRYEESIQFARAGIVANPDEFLLRNNLAFALASTGEVDEAERELDLINTTKLNEESRLVLTATKGLLAFRRGDATRGRELYGETIEKSKDPVLRAVAAIILAREEILARTPTANAARNAAEEFADRAGTVRFPDDVRAWLAHLRASVDREAISS